MRSPATRFVDRHLGPRPEDLERIDRAAPKGAAIGQRYPDMSTVNR